MIFGEQQFIYPTQELRIEFNELPLSLKEELAVEGVEGVCSLIHI